MAFQKHMLTVVPTCSPQPTSLDCCGRDFFSTREGQVRTDTDGSFLYLGRTNNVVKIRGIKVDLEGVERCITRLDHVDAAVVVAVRLSGSLSDDGTARSVVAFVKLANEAACEQKHNPFAKGASPLADDDAVRSVLSPLRGVLPAAAVPARVMFVDALPLSHNGKTDRLALVRWWSQHVHDGGEASRTPAPCPSDLPDWPTRVAATNAGAAAAAAAQPCAATNAVLRDAANKIAVVWRRRLGLDISVRIGYTSVFAECGGE